MVGNIFKLSKNLSEELRNGQSSRRTVCKVLFIREGTKTLLDLLYLYFFHLTSTTRVLSFAHTCNCFMVRGIYTSNLSSISSQITEKQLKLKV